MIKLSLYDFDKTIYNGDTGVEVLKFLFKHYPKKSYPYAGQLIGTILSYFFKINNKKQFKQNIYRIITQFSLDDWNKIIQEFWDIEKNRFFPDVIKQLHVDQENGYTIGIISASPELMLLPIKELVPCDFLIGTAYEIHGQKITTQMIGENCKREEKVLRLKKHMQEHFSNQQYEIKKMYSDSRHDMPLLELADEAFTIEADGSIRAGFPNENNNF
ncbi:MAG: HAD family hydrolase [Brevinema sp.]